MSPWLVSPVSSRVSVWKACSPSAHTSPPSSSMGKRRCQLPASVYLWAPVPALPCEPNMPGHLMEARSITAATDFLLFSYLQAIHLSHSTWVFAQHGHWRDLQPLVLRVSDIFARPQQSFLKSAPVLVLSVLFYSVLQGLHKLGHSANIFL